MRAPGVQGGIREEFVQGIRSHLRQDLNYTLKREYSIVWDLKNIIGRVFAPCFP